MIHSFQIMHPFDEQGLNPAFAETLSKVTSSAIGVLLQIRQPLFLAMRDFVSSNLLQTLAGDAIFGRTGQNFVTLRPSRLLVKRRAQHGGDGIGGFRRSIEGPFPFALDLWPPITTSFSTEVGGCSIDLLQL